MKKIVDFWLKADLSPKLGAGPHIHPEDEEIIERLDLAHEPICGPSEYERALRDGCLNDKQFHLTLLPQPYYGNIESASIIILLANPGLSALNFYLESKEKEFRKNLIKTINQEDCRHIFMNTKWFWTDGFQWWEQKLRGVASVIAERRGLSYGESLDLLSKEIASIEFVPYHSRNFGLKERLPSSEVAMDAARELSRDPKKTLIVTRKVRHWGLEDKENVVNYSSAHAQSASLGPNSPGGKKILKAFGIL